MVAYLSNPGGLGASIKGPCYRMSRNSQERQFTTRFCLLRCHRSQIVNALCIASSTLDCTKGLVATRDSPMTENRVQGKIWKTHFNHYVL